MAYDDIINLPHHISRKRPRMPLEDRAAQFSPFAAVVGHEAAVKETARLTDKKRTLSESEKYLLDVQFQEIHAKIESGHEVEIEYFVSDLLKSGGKYVVTFGKVKKIDVYERCILMTNGNVIALDDVVRVEIH